MAGLIQPRPQDLLRLAQPLDAVPEDAPAWVATALRAAPWAVVRRAAASEGQVAVGARGTARAQRFAMQIPETAVTEVLSPEALALRAATMRPALPVARALRAAAALLTKLACRGDRPAVLASNWPAGCGR
jgi:phosphoribosyl-dephospho-CoA transferase